MANYNMKNPAIKRIMTELKEFQKEPSDQFIAQPLDDNIFEWHFTIRGPAASDYEGGVYHGRIILPPEYPLKPPNIVLLTPNGRWEEGTKICLTISAHHPETWNPSWSIRTVLLALIGFMPTPGNGAIGSVEYPSKERKRLAAQSTSWKCKVCGSENANALCVMTANSVASFAKSNEDSSNSTEAVTKTTSTSNENESQPQPQPQPPHPQPTPANNPNGLISCPSMEDIKQWRPNASTTTTSATTTTNNFSFNSNRVYSSPPVVSSLFSNHPSNPPVNPPIAAIPSFQSTTTTTTTTTTATPTASPTPTAGASTSPTAPTNPPAQQQEQQQQQQQPRPPSSFLDTMIRALVVAILALLIHKYLAK